MCGFVAEIRYDNKAINKAAIQKRNDRINHRGPDDEGYYFCKWAGLGFKRLAIIDLSQAGHQPMSTDDERYIIVFNGEIYNYQSLRNELEIKGVKFNSKTDTEVVLRSFELWGKDVVKRFIGMFSFVLIDKHTKDTFVVRDHLGIKPLYLMKHDGAVHIASEIKCFEDIKNFELNEHVLYEYLSFGYVAGENTLFKDIYKVEPGTITTINKSGELSTNKFYNVVDTLKTNISENRLSDIKKLLDASIKNHTVSDVGYNIQLSGGIDSSYITAYLSSTENNSINSYSVTIDGALNEEKYQKQVVESYPTKHHSHSYNSRNLADNYIKATWHIEFPNMHLASPFLMMLCEESRKTSKVILTGEGADELFGGYSRFNIPIIQRIAYSLYKLKVPATIIPNIVKIRALKQYLREHPIHTTQRLISHDNLMQITPVPLKQNLEYRDQSMVDQNNLHDMMFANHQKCYLQSLLERQDKVSMAASVEARVPLCSPPLFDHINKISHKEKNKGGITKAIFKKIALCFFTKKFIYRSKLGFTLPIDKWLREKEGMGRFMDNLLSKPFTELPFFNHEKIETMVVEHKSGIKNWHKELIVLINFDIWYQLFITKTLKHPVK